MTNRLTWVGARDACASKKQKQLISIGAVYHHLVVCLFPLPPVITTVSSSGIPHGKNPEFLIRNWLEVPRSIFGYLKSRLMTRSQHNHWFGFQKPMKVKVVKWVRKKWNEHDLMPWWQWYTATYKIHPVVSLRFKSWWLWWTLWYYLSYQKLSLL